MKAFHPGLSRGLWFWGLGPAFHDPEWDDDRDRSYMKLLGVFKSPEWKAEDRCSLNVSRQSALQNSHAEMGPLVLRGRKATRRMLSTGAHTLEAVQLHQQLAVSHINIQLP